MTGQAESCPSLAGTRVLFVVHRFWPETGGIETHVYEVGRRLVQAGMDVTVLTTDRSRTLPTTETAAGMTVRRVPSYPRSRDYYLAPGLARAIGRDSWDIVHVQGIHSLVPPLAIAAASRRHLRTVVTLHTGGHSSRLRTAARRGQWLAVAPLVRRADAIIGVSRFEANMFAALPGVDPTKVHVIRNGGALPPPAAPATVEPSQQPRILSIGRLERYKGHHRLIEAMPHLLERRPNASALILGSGPMEHELTSLAKRLGVADRVSIRHIPGTDRVGLAAEIAAADLVVMLSDYESHPVAVMEALTLGRPVLVVRAAGAAELADEGWCASVAPGATAAQTARAIEQQLDSHAPPPDGVLLPTWDECAQELQQVYRGVLAGRR